MLMTVMFSLCPGTPGTKLHTPRTIKRTRTPAQLASYNLRIMPGSTRLFSLRVIHAFSPALAARISALINAVNLRRVP